MEECSGAVYEVVRLAVDQLGYVFSQQQAAEMSCLSSTALQEKESIIKSHANLISIVHELVSTAMLSVHPGKCHNPNHMADCDDLLSYKVLSDYGICN